MDCTFETFSARSFERFSQALAVHVLGSGIMVFGDGPDGGREATYDGSLSYPSVQDGWSGYVVMQAKFLQVPRGSADDANWLAAQLEDELQKFLDPESRLRKPQFYILVSNARLSPQPASPRGSGGLAKIDAVFERHREALGLIDYRVWHLDQLNAFLDNADSVRRTYAAWLIRRSGNAS